VLGGIAPLNVTLLAPYLPVSVLAILFATYTNAILGSSNLVTGVDPVSCSGSNCTSIFLPGGIFNARRVEPPGYPNLNISLLADNLLTTASAVIINSAPGYQVEFTPLDEDFTFFRNNCTMYGQTGSVGFYVCLASYNSSLMAGIFLHKPSYLNIRLEYLSGNCRR